MVKINFIFLTFAVCWSQFAFSTTFSATVDRTELAQDEYVMLTLSLINSDIRLRAEGINPNVDLSILSESFDVGVPKASFRYNIYKGAGRSSSELKVKLVPRRKGKFNIPAFNIDGKQTTPITINVLGINMDEHPEIFVRSGSNINNLWRGQQLVVYLDVFHRVTLKNPTFKSPLITEPSPIELIPHWDLPQDKRQAQHKGVQYDVKRIAWALFPDTEGTFTVHLPGIEVHTTRGLEKHFPSQSLDFQIKALPKNVPNNIIIGKPTITQTAVPETIKQHQLQHWTVTIKAPVAISSLPNYLPYNTAIEQIKYYPDRVHRNNTKTSNGIIDQGKYTLSIMPQEPGTYTLPPIQIPYFDPAKGKVELIELSAQNTRVEPGMPEETQPQLKVNTGQVLLEKKITTKENINWKVTAFVFALLWLGTLIFLLKTHRKYKPKMRQPIVKNTLSPKTRQASNTNSLQQKLLEALNTQTFEDGLKQCQKRFPAKPDMLITIRKLQRRVYGKQNEQGYEEKEVRDLIKTINTNQ